MGNLKPIPDHLKEDLNILFIGFNPSIRSSETGFHYANPNNRFWKILFKAGLTPHKFKPSDNEKLLELGYGLTNIVSRPTKSADEISSEEYQAGRQELKKKIMFYKPRIICFVGKGVYQQFSQKKNIKWGKQSEAVIQGTIDFVAPSSSGLVRMKLDEIVDIYQQLTNLLTILEKERNQ